VYTSPMGVLGKLADKWFLEAYMRNFLMQRNLYIKFAAEEAMRSNTSIDDADCEK
jgi:hypothetical protein